ncbi:hypothetical protein [Fulvivirga sp.]|uniref:hypothetical protein n=1 Tax=Fulvivirga sp. TaxID=1931237 RepID=UPI0032EE7B0C
MDTKNLLWHGVLSSTFASMAGVIYFEIYQYLMLSEFNSVVNWGSIVGASTLGCLLMMLGYWILTKFRLIKLMGWMNLLIAILSFASIIGAMDTALPLDIDYPELFPGLVVPMHFFPAVSFFGLAPFFIQMRKVSH